MKKKAVCFTDQGEQVIDRINTESIKKDIEPVEKYRLESGRLEEWTKASFVPGNALIFAGAVGIAVRAVSFAAKDKLSDCPVVVIDDNARFVIPILSGHAGGANKLAMILADLLDAIPVITTSTDVNGAFSVDSFASEKRLNIFNREGIKKVSVKALEEKKITLSIKDFPPAQGADVIVAEETDREYSLLLTPKKYTVGLGMKKNRDKEAVEGFFTKTLRENHIDVSEVYALCTIDLKEDEEALTYLRDKYRIPVLSFDAPLLKKAEGDFSASEFVAETVGVDNVCERAAVLGAGSGSGLILKKKAEDGMTIAIAERGGSWAGSM